ERIFARSWVPVCLAGEVAAPGDFAVVEVAGRSLIVCRGGDGALHAHHNVCRHRGARLCAEERGHVKRFFQCPYHAWAYALDGNWKLVAENFMEYYHLPWVHPGLVKVSPLNAHYRWQGTGMYTGFCTTPIAANTADGGWQGLPALPTLDSDDATSARFAWLFPNIAINALPN